MRMWRLLLFSVGVAAIGAMCWNPTIAGLTDDPLDQLAEKLAKAIGPYEPRREGFQLLSDVPREQQIALGWRLFRDERRRNLGAAILVMNGKSDEVLPRLGDAKVEHLDYVVDLLPDEHRLRLARSLSRSPSAELRLYGVFILLMMNRGVEAVPIATKLLFEGDGLSGLGGTDSIPSYPRRALVELQVGVARKLIEVWEDHEAREALCAFGRWPEQRCELVNVRRALEEFEAMISEWDARKLGSVPSASDRFEVWPSPESEPLDDIWVDNAEATDGTMATGDSPQVGISGIRPRDATLLLSLRGRIGDTEVRETVPVESGVSRVEFSLTTDEKVTLVVQRPDGQPVVEDSTTRVFKTSSGTRIIVEDPEPGDWSVVIAGAGWFSANVQALAKISLDCIAFVGFPEDLSAWNHCSASRRNPTSAAGTRAHVLAELGGPVRDPARLELRSVDGSHRRELDTEPWYVGYVGEAILPAGPFRIYVSGEDRQGHRFLRVSPRVYEAGGDRSSE